MTACLDRADVGEDGTGFQMRGHRSPEIGVSAQWCAQNDDIGLGDA